jgi:predicted  nucleic acid-binding Zn-ribbon protein
LLGILKQIEVGEVGTVNESLKNLKRKVYYFLNSYDKDRNEEIEIKELTEKRKEFSNELSKVEEIIETMKDLEEEVINCRQGQDSIVNELLHMSTNIEEKLRKRTEKTSFKEKFPKREISRIIRLGRDEVKGILGKDIRTKLLVVSNEVNGSNQEYYFNLIGLVIHIGRDDINVDYSSGSFDSEIKAIEKAIEMVEFKLLLTEEQERKIENKVKQVYTEEKEVNEEKDREKEKIIRELKRKLLKKFQEEIGIEKEQIESADLNSSNVSNVRS